MEPKEPTQSESPPTATPPPAAPPPNTSQDLLTEAIGDMKRWQIYLLLFVLYPTRTFGTWQTLGIIFIAPRTAFICIQTNMTNSPEWGVCYIDCVEYRYETEFENTIISQFNLICERAWMAFLIQAICMFGLLVGSLIFGYISDRYGRRAGILSSCVMLIITTLIQPFCPTYWLFNVVRFFVGIATGGIQIVPFILIMETNGPKRRELLNLYTAIPIALALMTMSALSFFFRPYNHFCISISVPTLIFFIYFYILPESPRYLITNGRLEEAAVIMEKAAKRNKMPPQNMLDVAKVIYSESSHSKTRATYGDLFREKKIRCRSIATTAVWFSTGISFYGSNQYIGQTSSNVFLSMSLGGLIQIPGLVAAALLNKYLGRRVTLFVMCTLLTICNGLLTCPESWTAFRICMGSMSIMLATGAYSSIFMYTSELFPTVTRNMAIGLSAMVSRFGCMIAPFIGHLHDVEVWIPPIIFALIPIIAIIAVITLPETRGKKLED